MEAVRIKRLSQTAGRRTEGRKTQRSFKRLGTGSIPGNATIGLGRFHSVALLPKLGVYVYGKLQILEDETDINVLRQIYDDLWPCYVRYHFLYHGAEPTKNYLETSGLVDAFALMLALLSQMMHNYAQIDLLSEWDPVRKRSVYFFCAYQECFTDQEWHVFHLKPVIKKLIRWHKGDLDIFIRFLNALDSLLLDTWYQGHMQWILDENMPEEIENMDGDPDAVKDLKKTLRSYETGSPYQVSQLIKNAYNHIDENGRQYVDLDILEIENNDHTKNEPIKSIIREGIKLLRMQKTIYQYDYIPDEYEDRMGLRFDSQFTIVWDINDTLSSYYEEFINVDAQEGVFAPYQFLYIKPDCDRLFIPDQFTKVLANFFDYTVDQLNEFTTPKTKRNAGNIK